MGDVSSFADKKNKLRRVGSQLSHRARRERPVVVSLTSYPARIDTVWRSVRSLFGQTRLPDKIVLYLAKGDFPNREADLPESLTSMLWHDFEIRWVDEDLKSHKKYFWAFDEFADSLVVTVDDDLIYRKTLVEELLGGHEDHPEAVIAARAHLIMFDGEGQLLPYTEWISEAARACPALAGVPSMRLLATTGAGTLFDPKLLKGAFREKWVIYDNCLFADDLWLKVAMLIAGVPVVALADERGIECIEGTQEVGLWANHNDNGGNDRTLAALLSNPRVIELLGRPFCELVEDEDIERLL